MTEENKTENKTEKTEPEAQPPGDRGIVGVATASKLIKQLWHETHFKLTDANDRYNPRKKMWVAMRGTPSLREFARLMLKDEAHGKLAKDWFAHKDGALNEKRSDKNNARISLEKQASKAARRKKGAAGKAKADKAAAPAA